MMSEILRRATPVDFEVRDDGGDGGRLICGICVPFNQPAEIRSASGSYVETFRPGSFERTIRERSGSIKLLAQHDSRSFPVGRAQRLVEDPRGLYGEFRVSRTNAGNELLTLVKDGAVDALSVGFSAQRDQWTPDHRAVDRLEVKLHEVSAVTFPAYADALISAVRSAELVELEERLAALTEMSPRGDTPSLSFDAARRRLAFASLGARNV